MPLACIDNDSVALRSHEANFGATHCSILNRDLSKTSIKEFTNVLGLKQRCATVIIGGPPCQGWSKVGRGKIRSLKQAGLDLLADPRNMLYRRFIQVVSQLEPAVCVMENVPGMLSIENMNVAEIVKANFEDKGYSCSYSLVNAQWFGVPQERHRLIFIATRPDIGVEIDASELKEFAKIFRRDILQLTDKTTVSDAIRDLPKIKNGAEEDPMLFRRPSGRPSRYAQLMREGSNGLLLDHICRNNAQDVEAFSSMKQGMKYFQLDDRFKRYRDDIFRDKYKKLFWNRPSWTVTAHLGHDCYTHIHPEQPRTISIREAARLQSFPDCFRFFGAMNDRFRQIGNAVPPLMAWGIAEFVKDRIGVMR